MIGSNIQSRRRAIGLTQEQLAAALAVARQTVAKWEAGDSVPDLANAGALAEALDVSLDALVGYDPQGTMLPMPPRGKHLFGTVTVGERGQIVIPKGARELFGIEPGDTLLLMADVKQGIAIVQNDAYMKFVDAVFSVQQEPPVAPDGELEAEK